jgi:hypothetical protein
MRKHPEETTAGEGGIRQTGKREAAQGLDIESLALPQSVYDIDLAWLREAFRCGGQEAKVADAERVEVIHGTCTKARFHLRYDRPTDMPTSVILKGAFEEHSERMKDMYQWEANFYHSIAPQVALNVPRALWSGIDPGGWRAAILMEDLDLRSVRFCRAQDPFTYDHLQRRLEQLAVLHAQTWESPLLQPGERWGWVPTRFDAYSVQFRAYYFVPDRWNHYVQLPRGVAVAKKLLDAGWMEQALARLGEVEASEPTCMIHGDTHPGNLYLDADGTPGFLDVIVARSAWWLEISYHLAASIDIAQRREWERPLLAHYLQALECAGGPRIEFDLAWLRYRQGLVYGLFTFLINETRFQTEAVNTAYTTRFGMAVIDHDSARLLA